MEVLVEYEYDALHDDELTLRPGDIIKNVRYIEEEGWMEGDLNGKRGVFPDNFVKELKKDPKEVKETRNEPKEEPGQPQGRESSVANLVKRISVIGIPTGGFQPMPPAASKKPKRRQCKVLFDYQPVNEDELELKVGDVVDILEEVEEGWWSGSLNGRSGLFPSNFVKELEAGGEEAEANDTVADKPDGSGTEPAATPTTPQPDSGNGATHQPRRIIGVGFGDIFKGGPVKLRTQPSPITEDRKVKDQEKDKAGPAQPVPSLPSAAKPAHPNMTDSQRAEVDGKHKAPTAKEFCKVKYAYDGKNEDELSLKEGELVHILSKDTGEPGWWRGEIGGRDGVFPNNFVTVVPEAEKEAAPSRGSVKSLAKPEVEEKLPKKPPPLASKPEPPTVERKSINHRPDFRPDERGDKHTPEPKLHKPPAPNPPKKPVPIPPKKPEKPIGPSLSVKHNGEVPSMRPKLDLEPPSIRPKSEFEPPSIRPKSEFEPPSIRPKLDLEPVLPTKPKPQPGERGDKPADADLMSFDELSSASEKLSHLTTSRPKPTKEVSAEKVFKVDEDESAKPKPTEHKKPSNQSPPPHRPGFAEPKPGPAAAAGLDVSISQNSRAHLEMVEQSAQQDELKSQIKDLLLSVELLKAQQMKEITELRRDLDEERVKRVALQIEVENLKKAIQST
ncbi:CD2-associated protein isoform X4 [Poecilia latipinna]|uniref:CD2-associated protein isoform X4 n=1 Tax=Poecilia latipinna TaxID=48699 RepID=UPI00072DAFAA|nr:PREDICTED: CD2-associated protein isoform X4 [Poecilia latipinna]